MAAIQFKVGSYHLHDDPNFNYQLNRLVSWGGGDLDEVREAARKITDCASWERELIALGAKAKAEGRIREASGYYRMAEFFMFHGNPNKMTVYDTSRELFYQEYASCFGAENGQIAIDRIPFQGTTLPCWHIKPQGKAKDTILLHGGNDSSIEEFLSPVLYFAEQGFEVYCFDGPGQGETLRKGGLTFIPEWEKPVGALLDYYGLEEVTIIGVSLGGMFAPRAAAFDKRIKRVVAWSILPNFLDVNLATRPPLVRAFVKFLLATKQAWLIDVVFDRLAEKEELVKWGLNHGKYAYGAKDAYGYLRACASFDMLKIADKIDQDFLLLGARQDHFIAFDLYKPEIDALANVKSLTFRAFSDREEAGAHCNLGNMKLALDTIMDWIRFTKARDESAVHRMDI
jgi:pimeloyl-ACP methyl ester carboxylesterase